LGLDIAQQTTIDAPRDSVWAYLADFGRHPEWARPEDQLRIQPPTEVRAGATFTSVGKDMGRDSKNEVTITEVVPGERIVYVAEMDKGTVWRNAFELEQVGGRTRVTKRETLVSARFPFNVILAILSSLMRGELTKMHAADLARIKARLEQRAVAEVA
jgi:uncharacterized protein YndB with AHSA1/START domain